MNDDRTPVIDRPGLRAGLTRLGCAGVLTCLGEAAVVISLWFLVRWLDGAHRSDAESALVLMAAGAVLVTAGAWLAHQAEARCSSVARRAVAAQLVRLPRSTVAEYGTPAARRLITDDVDALHHLLAHLPSELASLLVVPVLAIGLLVHECGPLALVALVPGLVAAYAHLVILPRHMAVHGARGAALMTSVVDAAGDYGRGVQVARTFGSDADALARYLRATQEFTTGFSAWVVRAAGRGALVTALLQATTTYAIAAVVGIGWSIPHLAALLFFSLAVVTPARRLGHDLDYARTGREALGRIRAFLALEPVRATGRTAVAGTGAVEVEGATLVRGEKVLLRDAGGRFPHGTLGVLTGPSGSGKTSLLTVIAGLDDLDAGQVRLGADDGDAVLVPQDCSVLAASIADNLRLANPTASDDALLAALRRARLDLPLDTPAEQLSGGERQRLAIARALLTEARLVLLDEPTAGLDTDLRVAVTDELAALAREGRTVIAVTHDPTVIDAADVHARVEGGRLLVRPSTDGEDR